MMLRGMANNMPMIRSRFWVLRACLRVTAGVDHRQTGNLAFHEFCGVADLTSVEVLGLHGSHGRGDVAFALCAVTDDHHFVEQCVVFLECHIVAGCYLL